MLVYQRYEGLKYRELLMWQDEAFARVDFAVSLLEYFQHFDTPQFIF